MKSINRIFLFCWLSILICMSWVSPAFSHQEHEDSDEFEFKDVARPDGNYVWEEGAVRPDGEVVEGFWREAAKPGYAWQSAGWDENDDWVDYDFLPEESAPAGMDWSSGYRGNDGLWKMGFWRRDERDGFEWRDGGYAEGEYVAPQWDPIEIDEEEETYEPGYRADTGYWIPGYVRPEDRDGYTWNDSYWDASVRTQGYWQPNVQRVGSFYVPGHVGSDGYWVPGYWRETSRDGFAWVNGYYLADEYVWGFWRPLMSRAHHTWVVGYSNAGSWSNGYWRANARTGHYWLPGRHYRGAYVAGRWYAGHAPRHGSHRHYRVYNRHIQRARYHQHHVAKSKAHHGPHYRMSASKLWRKKAKHKRHMAKNARHAAKYIRNTRLNRPYRMRNQRAKIMRNRQPLSRLRAGRKVRNVKYNSRRHSNARPAKRTLRPTHNSRFRPFVRPSAPPAWNPDSNKHRSHFKRNQRKTRGKRVFPGKRRSSKRVKGLSPKHSFERRLPNKGFKSNKRPVRPSTRRSTPWRIKRSKSTFRRGNSRRKVRGDGPSRRSMRKTRTKTIKRNNPSRSGQRVKKLGRNPNRSSMSGQKRGFRRPSARPSSRRPNYRPGSRKSRSIRRQRRRR